MRAAILDGTLWLCFFAQEGIPCDDLSVSDATCIRHILDLSETQRVAALFGEDVPTLLSKTFHIDVHTAWHELTQPQELCSN